LRLIFVDNQSNVEKLNPQSQQWESSNIASVEWKNITISSDELEISILPNGYITPSVISLEQDNTHYQFNSSLL
jgi:hypothetical protein